ncbi:MAG: enoyl-CoA hydratase-related protein [Actinomycetota bacterium]|nr:enoyl-CoA hydratase-related protein [Actinomycetota bacterium]
MSELVTSRLVDAYAHIELNRPETLNAWTADMGRQLLEHLANASADPDVRAILLTGAGRAFSAGADVKDPREAMEDGAPDLTSRLRDIYNPIVLTVRAAPKPVVGAVHGAVAGLGASLALACDLLIASQDAYFLLAFVRIGVMPDAGASTFLAERVGIARAAELAMLGEKLPAAKALDWGVVNAVLPDDELLAAGHSLAAMLATGPTVALANIKRSLSAAAQRGLAEQVAFEADLQQTHATTHDYAEGVAAFKEKRPTVFRGC